MATIRKRNSKWQVQIRRDGFKPVSKSFARKSDAIEWANFKERQADRRDFQFDPKKLDYLTWGDLLERYRDEVVPQKKCVKSETAHINAYLKRNKCVATLKLSQLKPFHFTEYRDFRLQEIKPATICRELGIFHHVFEIAKTEWSVPISINPITLVKKPRLNNKRDRRLETKEYAAILRGARTCSNPFIKPIIQIALYTGMRRGEILNIKTCDIDFKKRTLVIPATKTGYSRTIPLSQKALKIFRVLKTLEEDSYIFPLSVNALRLSWDRLVSRAGVKNLKFHDLRHEAISCFFEKGLSIPEVALISGHRSYAMLARYTHLKAENLVEKL